VRNRGDPVYRIAVILVAVVHIGCLLFSPPVCEAGIAPEEEWKAVIRERSWVFPEDHGAHPEYRTEWWYFTGNLTDRKGNRYGYQLTFFRYGLVSAASHPENPWSVRDIYPAHFSLTDVSKKRFWHSERVSRAGPGLAGSSKTGMDIWNLNWSAKMKGDKIFLFARTGEMELRLHLKPGKPKVFHGSRGLSRKGEGKGQASYYYSFTNLVTEGYLKTPQTVQPLEVKGASWFDHEFGSNQLSKDQQGWDWFSLRLSDGRELMLYFLRKADGSVEPASAGTLIEASGQSRYLNISSASTDVLDRWKSPKSGGVYPSRWRIHVPLAGIELTVYPLVADQELITEGSTGITYWEGAVAGKGRSAGRPVTCEGYVEMTGYAGSLGGIF
jgi:predicted secreted hydrolase